MIKRCLVLLGLLVLGSINLDRAPVPVSHGSPTVTVAGYFSDPALIPTSGGGWVLYTDGAVSGRFGAAYHGGLPADHISVNDIVGMIGSPDGGGYVMVGADGGVFAFGNGRYLGSLPGSGITPNSPIIGVDYCNNEAGYALVGLNGEFYPYNCG